MRQPDIPYRYKAIFSDIDGTLLNSSHQITPDTRREILRLEKNGVPFVLVSARMPDGITTIQQQLGSSGPMVCYSGGLVLGADGKVLLSRQIPLDLALEVKELLNREYPLLCCSAYGYNQWVADDKQNPWILREEAITSLKALTGGIREWFSMDGGIHKFLLMGEPDEIDLAARRLKKAFPQVKASRSMPAYLEIMDRTAGKAEGVRFLCNYFGITTEEAIAIGDGQNDIDMLRAVGCSYAMGNAPEEVKENAAHVTLDHDHEGLLAALRDCMKEISF